MYDRNFLLVQVKSVWVEVGVEFCVSFVWDVACFGMFYTLIFTTFFA